MILTRTKYTEVNGDEIEEKKVPTPCAILKNGEPVLKIEGKDNTLYSGVCVENAGIEAFTYSKIYYDGYGRGDGETYLDDSLWLVRYDDKSCWAEHPNPYPLNTSGATKVIISNNSDYSNGKTYNCNRWLTLIYNLIPNITYYCKFLDDTDKKIRETTIMQTGKVRMLYVPNLQNVRDIGGWECFDNDGNKIGHLAYGKVIRGSARDKNYIKGTTKEAKDCLVNEIGVKFELNTADSSYRILTSADCKTYNTTYYGASNGMTSYANVFLSTTSATTKGYINKMFSAITNDKCVYVHCSQGADRTGTICAILEALCGCNDDAIIKDWEMTSFMRILSTRRISRIDHSGDELRFLFRGFYDNYGGSSGKTLQEQVESWLLKIGITQTQIDDVKNKMIVYD